VNGEKVTDWAQLKRLVGSHPDETISVDVDRGGERKTFSVTTEGSKIKVAPFIEHESLSGGEVLAAAFAAPFDVVRKIVRGFFVQYEPELVGPVGVSKEVAAASKEGSGTFFRLVGALASYQGAFIAMVLLCMAFFMGFAGKRTLPTSGDSS
jgi:hypothetical protein